MSVLKSAVSEYKSLINILIKEVGVEIKDEGDQQTISESKQTRMLVQDIYEMELKINSTMKMGKSISLLVIFILMLKSGTAPMYKRQH